MFPNRLFFLLYPQLNSAYQLSFLLDALFQRISMALLVLTIRFTRIIYHTFIWAEYTFLVQQEYISQRQWRSIWSQTDFLLLFYWLSINVNFGGSGKKIYFWIIWWGYIQLVFGLSITSFMWKRDNRILISID